MAKGQAVALAREYQEQIEQLKASANGVVHGIHTQAAAKSEESDARLKQLIQKEADIREIIREAMELEQSYRARLASIDAEKQGRSRKFQEIDAG